jgi:hypothetical protein
MKRTFGATSAGSILCILLMSSCSSPEDLYPVAQCSDEALSSRTEDAPKIMDLLPDDTSQVYGKLQEHYVWGYHGDCLIKGNEYPEEIRGYASFNGKEEDPEKTFTAHLPSEFGKGLRPIRATGLGVVGVSGSGSAQIWFPCSLQEGAGGPEGFMLTSIMARAAPNPDSKKQRQNAADLALSFLRYAAEKCDKHPELPKSVVVNHS